MPHNMFVYKTLMADIKARICQAMAASIKALFILLGRPKTEFRRCTIDMDKFLALLCS